MGERRRRLVPLILEAVERPVWLYDIVGIDFTPGRNGRVDPFAKLHAALALEPRSWATIYFHPSRVPRSAM